MKVFDTLVIRAVEHLAVNIKRILNANNFCVVVGGRNIKTFHINLL